MKVLMVADARSVHTRRWAVSLYSRGIDIVLFSLYPSPDDFFETRGIPFYYYDVFTYKRKNSIPMAGRLLRHFQAVRVLKALIRKEKPDILHAHYATSFGLVAALAGFHPFIVSVWGSDVYEFPYLSALNGKTVRMIFRKADKILSTSHAMAVQTSRFTDRRIEITPFGVDMELFRPVKERNNGCFVVGNVKTLSPKYGIDVLIKAYGIFRRRNPELESRLVIVGDGPCRGQYRQLCSDLGLSQYVEFVGRVDNSELPRYYNSFSVAVSLSNSESFGVVAVEAMSCCCPVVVSDADGFKEIVEDTVTGFIVPKGNPDAAAAAIQRFADDPDLRCAMGEAGRRRVEKYFNWDDNVSKMIDIYRNV